MNEASILDYDEGMNACVDAAKIWMQVGDYWSIADYNLKLLLFKRIKLHDYIVSVNFVVCGECSCYLSSHCTQVF